MKFVRFVFVKNELRGLFDNALFEVFSEVGADFGGGTFGGDFGDVGVDHDLYQLLERGLGGVPAELGLSLGGVAPEVDDVGGAVEVGADFHEGLAY